MEKLKGTLLAIKELLIGFYQMRIASRLPKLLLYSAITLVALFLIIAFTDAWHFHRYEQREQKREVERQKLESQAAELRDQADQAESKAAELEKENSQLKEQINELRLSVDLTTRQRKEVQIRHVQKKQQQELELETITDASALRRANCERRKLLGYPCPDDE